MNPADNALYAELDRLKRERDALADALENIAADGTTYLPGWEKFGPAMTWAAKKARAALDAAITKEKS